MCFITLLTVMELRQALENEMGLFRKTVANIQSMIEDAINPEREENPFLVSEVPVNNTSVDHVFPETFVYGFMHSDKELREGDHDITNDTKLMRKMANYIAQMNNDDIADWIHEHSKTRLTKFLFTEPFNRKVRVAHQIGLYVPGGENEVIRCVNNMREFVDFEKAIHDQSPDLAGNTGFTSELCLRKWCDFTYRSVIWRDISKKDQTIDKWNVILGNKKVEPDNFVFGYSINDLKAANMTCLESLSHFIKTTKNNAAVSIARSVAEQTHKVLTGIHVYMNRVPGSDDDVTKHPHFFSGERALNKTRVEGGEHPQGKSRYHVFDVSSYFDYFGLLCFAALYCYDVYMMLIFRTCGYLFLAEKTWFLDLNRPHNRQLLKPSDPVYKQWENYKLYAFLMRKMINTFHKYGMRINGLGKTIMLAIGVSPQIKPLYDQYIKNAIKSQLLDDVASIYARKNEIEKYIYTENNLEKHIMALLTQCDLMDVTLEALKNMPKLKPHFKSFVEIQNLEPLRDIVNLNEDFYYDPARGTSYTSEFRQYLENVVEERKNALERLSAQASKEIADERKLPWYTILLETLKEFRTIIGALIVFILALSFSGPISSLFQMILNILQKIGDTILLIFKKITGK